MKGFKIMGVLLITIISSIMLSCGLFNIEGSMVNQKRKAVVMIRSHTDLMVINTTATTAAARWMRFSFVSSGTGAIIDHRGKSSFVLTAAHICDVASKKQIKRMVPEYNEKIHKVLSSKTHVILNFYGSSYQATPLVSNPQTDVCVLLTPRIEGIKALRVANTAPFKGEKVFYMGFPRGLGQPGFVPAFEGFYAGIFRPDKDHYCAGYTFPLAPGSSGSPIVNIYGEVVGIIHSYYPIFDNIALGATQPQIEYVVSLAEDTYESNRPELEKRVTSLSHSIYEF